MHRYHPAVCKHVLFVKLWSSFLFSCLKWRANSANHHRRDELIHVLVYSRGRNSFLLFSAASWIVSSIFIPLSPSFTSISVCLILGFADSSYHACRHALCLLSCFNDPITAQHLPRTSKPPSDTSSSQSWHSALTSAKTWQPSTYQGGSDLRE